MAVLDKSRLPFTYSGTWDAYDYNNGKMFYARFLSSGTFTPNKPLLIDIFAVGGGGGGAAAYYNSTSHARGGDGGGGGYTKCLYDFKVSQSVAVTIGNGGAASNIVQQQGLDGDSTRFGSSLLAAGGQGGLPASSDSLGSAGGSSGGIHAYSIGGNARREATAGASDGNGANGQGTTTRAFGGDHSPFNTMLFSGGGGGGGIWVYYGAAGGEGGGGSGALRGTTSNLIPALAGQANSGGGGGGGGGYNANPTIAGASGGSGIVIIRGVLNNPPGITGADANLGDLTETGLSYEYTVTDEDQSTLSVVESLDGVRMRAYTAVCGQPNTAEIPADTWTRLLNGTHTFTITATDDMGESVVRKLTFVKDQSAMEFVTVNPAPNAARPSLLTVQLTGAIPAGAAVEYFACNNGLDEEPAWEDITTAVLGGLNFAFVNTVKLAEHWAVRVQVRVNRGNLDGDCHASSLFFAYQTEDN